MSESIHPLVLATIENERARRELELERLRSAREACVTSSAGGQNRALALGKKIRELEKIVGSWRLVLATMLGEMDEMTQAAEGATAAFQELATMLVETEETPQVEFSDGSTIPGETDEQFKRRMDLTGPPVVGSKSPRLGKLRCVACTTAHKERFGDTGRLVDVTSEDLPDGGVCVSCHGDVLA